MPRLFRPAVPLEVKCRVALRQLGCTDIDGMIERNKAAPSDAYLKSVAAVLRRSLGRLLAEILPTLADSLGCSIEELRLDHHPALENRTRREVTKFNRRRGRYVTTMIYTPDANSPDDLLYRTKHDHDIKTRVRGDGAQFADNVIAKRERKRVRKAMRIKRGGRSGRKVKAKWPSRPLRSRSTF